MPTPVLLLSNDEQAVHVVDQVLAELGFAVEQLKDSSIAAKNVQSRSYSALLIDCDDVIAAKQVLDALRASQLNKTAPAIAIVSGRAGVPNAFRLGAEFVVTKPASLDQVRHTIRAAVTRTTKKETIGASQASATPAPPVARAAAASAAASVASQPEKSIVSPFRAAIPNFAAAESAPAAKQASNLPAGAAKASAPTRALQVSVKPKVAPLTQPGASRPQNDDPVLAELDELESQPKFSAPPFEELKLRRRTPILAIVIVMLLLGSAAGYYAFSTRPDFRDFVLHEYGRVRELIGMPLPPQTSPVQSVPAEPSPVTQPTSAAPTNSTGPDAPQQASPTTTETPQADPPANVSTTETRSASPAADTANPQY